MKELMRDSDHAAHIPEGWQGAVGGYLHGGNATRPWPASDWRRFRYNRKLPIFAQSRPAHPVIDAQSAIAALRAIGAPPGVYTALDLEDAVDPPYVRTYGKELRQAGYKVWVYGQASTVFGNPALNGYWVANWKGYLRLSLVSCPILLYPSTLESEKVRFNQINKGTGHRIKMQKVDAATGEVVDADEIVKGYKAGDEGEYLNQIRALLKE